MTPFDRLQALRALSYAAMGACATTAIVVTTDEQYSSAAMRLARMAAIGPVLGAVAVFAAAQHARATGETRALESVGMPPWRVVRGALYAAWLVTAAGVLALLVPATDVSALFPVIASSSQWVAAGDGSLSSADLGVRVFPDGALAFVPSLASADPERPERLAAIALVGPAALVAPLWASMPASWPARVVALLASAAAAIVALHLVAAERMGTAICVAPSLLLAVHGLGVRLIRR